MYTVLVKGSNGQWRSTQESALTACVMLTMGLACEWRITRDSVNGGSFYCNSQYVGNPKVHLPDASKYLRTMRDLLYKWTNKLAWKGQMALKPWGILDLSGRTKIIEVLRKDDNQLLCFHHANRRFIESQSAMPSFVESVGLMD